MNGDGASRHFLRPPGFSDADSFSDAATDDDDLTPTPAPGPPSSDTLV